MELWCYNIYIITIHPSFNGSSEEEIMKKIEDGIYDLKEYPLGVIFEETKDLL